MSRLGEEDYFVKADGCIDLMASETKIYSVNLDGKTDGK